MAKLNKSRRSTSQQWQKMGPKERALKQRMEKDGEHHQFSISNMFVSVHLSAERGSIISLISHRDGIDNLTP